MPKIIWNWTWNVPTSPHHWSSKGHSFCDQLLCTESTHLYSSEYPRASWPFVSNVTRFSLWTLSFYYYWNFSPCNLKRLTADLNRVSTQLFLKFPSFLVFSGLLTLPYSSVTPDRAGHTLPWMLASCISPSGIHQPNSFLAAVSILATYFILGCLELCVYSVRLYSFFILLLRWSFVKKNLSGSIVRYNLNSFIAFSVKYISLLFLASSPSYSFSISPFLSYNSFCTKTA